MAKGHLSEDTIKFIMTAETTQLQQEIHKSGKALDELKRREAGLRKEQAAVKSVLGEESKEYKDLAVKIKTVIKDIADENLKLTELHKRLGTGSMTMAQLRKEAKQLQRQLDNTSQALNPQEYEVYASKLQEVNQRMAELKTTAQGLSVQNNGGGFIKKFFGAETDLKGLKTFLAGNAITKFATMAAEAAVHVGNRVKELVTESVNAARAAEGITHAFERMDQPGLLDSLRRATHGTVSDLELMKAAVQAQDFRLPLDQLGKYLEFAQLKAQQTGQSVDYLVNSIVTGLGRKSVMILDNLGLSASQIKEEMAKGGDMAQAVGRIIDQQLDVQGEHYETAAERETRATTNVTNAQLELGNQMQKTFGIGSTSFSEMQSKAEVFVLKGLTKLIIYCQDLYRRLGSVRAGVETVKVTFDTVFKVCELGFLWLIDTVKGVGRVIRDLGSMVEGVFTFDWDKVKNSWNDLGKGLVKTMVEFVKDGKNVGERWGQNVVDSINATMGKAKINSPKPANELDELVVTGSYRDKPGPEKTTNHKNTTDTANNKKDAAAVSRFASQRQQDLEAARRAYQEDANALKQALADKRLSQVQYNAMASQLSVEHTRNLQDIEQSYYERAQQLTISDGEKKQQLISRQQKNLETAQQQSFDAQLKLQQDYNAAVRQLEEAGTESRQMTLQEKESTELSALKGYYDAALELARRSGEDEKALTEAYERAKQAIRNRYAQQQAEQDKANQERLKQLKTQWWQTDSVEEVERQRQLLEQMHRDGIMAEEEYQKRLKELRTAGIKASIDMYVNLFSSAFTALQDAELSQVESKYDAEIAAAKKAGKDTTKLEEQKEAEKLKVQKKYADVNFAIKCAEIISNTAVSIMKALAELGPIAGPIAAALMGVTGAAQLAVAKAERDRVKNMTAGSASASAAGSGARVATGREEGGYVDVERAQDGRRYHARYDPRRRGYVDRPTVIVGEGPAGQSKEWVASNDAVENPTVRPVIDAIDQAQRAGNVRMLDLNKVLLQRGLATGGSISPVMSGPTATPGGSPSGSVLARLTDILERIEQNGVQALLGLDEVDALQKLREQSRKIGSKP